MLNYNDYIIFEENLKERSQKYIDSIDASKIKFSRNDIRKAFESGAVQQRDSEDDIVKNARKLLTALSEYDD